jgi:hypothetical protein
MYDILQALQIRKQKREEVLAKKRCRGGQSTPCFIFYSLIRFTKKSK